MDFENVLKWVAVATALSGWFKVFLDHLGNKPKLAGRILCVMKGRFKAENFGEHTSYMVYPYLVNKRKNTVHVLDYEFYVKLKRFGKWQQILRVYGMEALPNCKFTSNSDSLIAIENLGNTLIYRKKEPVQHGVPLHGWIPFFGDMSLFDLNSYRYKLICIDAYGNRHSIVSKGKEGINPYLLMEVAEIKLPSDMLPKNPLAPVQ